MYYIVNRNLSDADWGCWTMEWWYQLPDLHDWLSWLDLENHFVFLLFLPCPTPADKCAQHCSCLTPGLSWNALSCFWALSETLLRPSSCLYHTHTVSSCWLMGDLCKCPLLNSLTSPRMANCCFVSSVSQEGVLCEGWFCLPNTETMRGFTSSFVLKSSNSQLITHWAESWAPRRSLDN